ncbi:unnamed protein product [Rotaria magnacalcarata]|uniref:Uncharacterized protein n=1 Tax=Rotaria magnacalcarata TaxID=392030 RepID=A0A8S2SG02_9BILA|nr:unnamed protein product [Rotaria magnacalcarata]CAF4227876.1 unnamed protein product [Rotaria magnacalcarata]
MLLIGIGLEIQGTQAMNQLKRAGDGVLAARYAVQVVFGKVPQPSLHEMQTPKYLNVETNSILCCLYSAYGIGGDIMLWINIAFVFGMLT